MAIPIYSDVDVHGDMSVNKCDVNDLTSVGADIESATIQQLNITDELTFNKAGIHTATDVINLYRISMCNSRPPENTTQGHGQIIEEYYGITFRFWLRQDQDNSENYDLLLSIQNPQGKLYTVQVHEALFHTGRDAQGDQLDELASITFTGEKLTSSSLSTTFNIASLVSGQLNYVPDYLMRATCSISINDISTIYTEQDYTANLHIPGRNIDGDICLYSKKYTYIKSVTLPANTDNIKFSVTSYIPITVRCIWSDDAATPMSYTASRPMEEGTAYIHITGLEKSSYARDLYIFYDCVDNLVCIQPDKLIIGYGNVYKHVQWSDIATKI